MPPENPIIIYILLAVIILFFAAVLLVSLVMKLDAFSRERKYIDREIQRSTGEERKYWQQKKRRLWRMFLPFYRG